MGNYVLFTDSCIDMTEQMVNELCLKVLPLSLELDGKGYRNFPDNRDIKPQDFYAKLREGKMASTSQVNVIAFCEAFEPTLQSGQDVLYIAFSSGLSGTFNSSCIAAEELKEKYPDRKIICIDSLSASMGQGMLIYHITKLKNKGLDIDALAKWIQDNRLKQAHWFTVDDLNFLKRGGRVSGAAAFFGTMLNVKPILHVDDEGHLIPMEKVRGRKASLDALVEHMRNDYIPEENDAVFISHGDCLEDAKYLETRIKEEFKIKDIYINYVGPVIGSHSGPGTMALFFVGNKR